MCKKHTSVSHSSTQSEIISLEAGLRMDVILALDLWGVVAEVSRSPNSTKTPTNPAAGNCSRNHKSKRKQKGNRDVDQLLHSDYVTTNANSSQGESQLYIFEDNEAVIKMITKGRSPTIRHVSRIHRVALDWSFDRINLDPKIQIKYVDTKKPTRGHVNQRKFHSWWMRPSPSFFEYHEFLDVFLQPFSFKQRAECHVQGSSGKYFWRRFGSCETETAEFGVK